MEAASVELQFVVVVVGGGVVVGGVVGSRARERRSLRASQSATVTAHAATDFAVNEPPNRL